MADNESSHLMWIIIVIAIAALIFMGLKVAFPSLIDKTMDKMTQGVKGVDFQVGERPDENNSKWVDKGNYGSDGRFVMDKDGHALVYAPNGTNLIKISKRPELTYNNSKLKTLTYLDPVELSGDLGGFFYNDVNLEKINGLENWDTSKVSNMSSLFNSTKSLQNLDGISSWDLSNVKNTNLMFYNAGNLNSLDLSKWDTSNVTDMEGMFNSLTKLEQIKGLSNFKTSKVTSMKLMFYKTSSLKSIEDISNWNVSKLTNKTDMFKSSAVQNIPSWYN